MELLNELPQDVNNYKLSDLLDSWDSGAWGEPSINPITATYVLRSTNFLNSGELNLKNQALLDIDARTYEKKRLYPNDILLERSGGGEKQPVGRVTIFRENGRFICGNFISCLRVKKDIVEPEYLLLRLLNVHWSGQTEKFQTATTGIRNLQMKDYLNQEFLVPNIKEQQQIAAKLKAQLAEVETARKALQAQQAEIKHLAETVLDSLFSHPNKEKIGTVAKVQSGYAFKSKDFQTQGVKLLRNTNILPNKIYWDDLACVPCESINYLPNYVINEGDVILSLDRPIISTGLKVARISKNDIPALLVQRVGRFLIDESKLDADYLYFFLNTSFFKGAISGHEQSLGVPHISPTQVENVEIPLPDTNEQKKIAAKALEIFKQIEIAKIAAKEAQNDIDSLPSRLLVQAFDTLSTP